LTSVKLLEEYKNIVDESLIVTKTDLNCIITYVNDKFCRISGYQYEELIGKNHNIVRHPDILSSVYTDIWHTIKKLKKTWKGKIKNKKKDGTYYWVEALIKPILDTDGEIIEFIGLRTDITEIECYKASLKNTLDDTSKSLKENKHYTLQYEEAINKFTAILKTNTDGLITFCNEMFCNLSGYSKEELIGINCQNLRHNNHIILGDCDRLKRSLLANKHISIIFTNITKDNSLYFLDTMVYPITNIHGKVIEHLHIMHDITELKNIDIEIEDTQKEIIYKMGEISESRSKETANHVKRVAEYSRILAQLYGLSEDECNILFTASPMHDIGKVAISDEILKKPGKLTDEQFEIMKTHPEIGYAILKDSKREILKAAAIVAYQHHEKWNGNGYPQGLKGNDIHIYGRITAIADVFDAIGTDRCYKKAWDYEKILEYFQKGKGEQFDPTLIDLFCENKKLFFDICDKYADTIDT